MRIQSASTQSKPVFTAGANVAALYNKAIAWDYTLIKRYAVEKGIYAVSEIDRVVDELSLPCTVGSVPWGADADIRKGRQVLAHAYPLHRELLEYERYACWRLLASSSSDS